MAKTIKHTPNDADRQARIYRQKRREREDFSIQREGEDS